MVGREKKYFVSEEEGAKKIWRKGNRVGQDKRKGPHWSCSPACQPVGDSSQSGAQEGKGRAARNLGYGTSGGGWKESVVRSGFLRNGAGVFQRPVL